MASHLFVLGSHPQLSLAELHTVLTRQSVKYSPDLVHPHLAVVQTQSSLDPQLFINTLGGTVKIATVLKPDSDPVSDGASALAGLASGHKLSFSVSSLMPEFDSKDTSLAIKQHLKQQGVTARYSFPKDIFASAKHKQTNHFELFIFAHHDHPTLACVTAVQNIDSWSHRDYDRPRAQPKAGMLPPKVARMMVNLALPQPITANTTVYDPFCGSGTILAESLLLGSRAIGSDLSPQSVQDSQANLDWLSQQYPVNQTWKVITQDAAHASREQIGTVSAVVTEPYLGPPHIKPSKVDNLIKGLSKLYKGALKNLHPLLKNQGRVVIVVPQFAIGGRVKTLKSLIDTCENIGYTRLQGPYIYAREGAVVQRTIYILQKIPKE